MSPVEENVQQPLKGWRLAHISVGSPDPQALAAFYQEYVGLGISDEQDGAVFLTTDEHHHCLGIYPAESRTLRTIGFEVRDTAELERIASRLEELGVAQEPVDPAPGRERALAFETPDDVKIELIAGDEASDAVVNARPMRPKKIGHVGLRVTDIDRSMKFFTEVLGFRISDWIGHAACFLRCNSDHHVVVLFADAPGPGASSLQHVAFEGDGWDSFRSQSDHLSKLGRPLEWGPGRHKPSGNIFMYFRDDDGNRIEWMMDAGLIWDDETRPVTVHDPTDPLTWNLWQVMPPPGFMRSLDEDGTATPVAPITADVN